MSVVEFLIYVLAVAGASHLVVDSRIFDWPRTFTSVFLPSLHSILQCYGCVGLFVGALCGLLLNKDISTIILLGLAGSYVADISELCKNYLESRII